MVAEGSALNRSPLRTFTQEACQGTPSDQVYGDAQARLVRWRKDLLSTANFEAHQGIRELCHEQEHLKDLKSDLASVRELVEAASHLEAGGARLAEVVQNSAEASSTRAAALARLRDELNETSAAQGQELRQEEEMIAQRQAIADTRHAEALKLVNTYKDRLGLAITREAPQTVRMAFSLLDGKDPCREFSFTLGLGGSDEKASESYRVRNCVPQVPELAKLVNELNTNATSATALPRFVCSIRRAFIKTVEAGAARAA